MLQIHNRYADVMRRQLNTAVHKKQQSQATRNRICIHGIIPDFIKKEQGEKKENMLAMYCETVRNLGVRQHQSYRPPPKEL